MTPDEAAFFQAILDAPDDDTPRLIYADWLEERGQSDRAEFIRVQCELRELQHVVLSRRERELQTYLESTWKPQFDKHYYELSANWRRGILEGVHYQGGLFDANERIDKLIDVSARFLPLGPVGTISIHTNNDLAASTLQRLLASPWMRFVRVLSLGCIDVGIAQLLAGASCLSQLRELALFSNSLDLEGVRQLVTESALTGLSALSLYRESLGPDVVPLILDSPCLHEVTKLALPGIGRPALMLTGG